MAEPIYVWVNREGGEGVDWSGWRSSRLTLQKAAEDVLKDLPPGTIAHCMRKMGVRKLSVRVDGEGRFIRLGTSRA